MKQGRLDMFSVTDAITSGGSLNPKKRKTPAKKSKAIVYE